MVGAGAVGATGRPRRGVGATGLGTTRRGGDRPGDDEEGRRVGDDLKAGHGRAPAGDPRTAGEERGGARGRASQGRQEEVGAAGNVDLNWAAKGVICWGWLG